jgi:AraC family transcriptional regulator
MSASGALRLAAGKFFGAARLARTTGGIEVAHRIAEAPPEVVVTHTHADAHFILVTGGDYISAAEGPWAPGTPLLIYNPVGTTHRDRFEEGRGSFFSFSLRAEYICSALADTLTPQGPCYLVEPAQHGLARGIATCCARAAEDLALEGLCMELLGTLDRKPPRMPARPPRWLERALELLQARYREELSIADIAGSVGVHPIHLARTFRRHFRCTPGAFARFVRLERSATLLARTSQPLAEVAQEAGFADQSHFSRAFARGFGLPPGEYRAVAGGPRFRLDKTQPTPWRTLCAEVAYARARAKRRR